MEPKQTCGARHPGIGVSRLATMSRRQVSRQKLPEFSGGAPAGYTESLPGGTWRQSPGQHLESLGAK